MLYRVSLIARMKHQVILLNSCITLAGCEQVNQECALIQEAFGKQAVPFPKQELRNWLIFRSHWFSYGLKSLGV